MGEAPFFEGSGTKCRGEKIGTTPYSPSLASRASPIQEGAFNSPFY